MVIPLFPLSSMVLPDGLLPLRIFERRYLDLVKNCFKDNSGFGICLIKSGQEVGEAAEPHLLGTQVKIQDWDQSRDGLLEITVQGLDCFRILDTYSGENNLLMGEVEPLPLECPLTLQDEFKPLARKLEQLLNRLKDYIDYPQRQLDNAVWVSNRLIEILPLTPQDKITLLLMQSSNDRLRVLNQLMDQHSI